MIQYLGNLAEDATIDVYFNTYTSNDPSASATITNFADTDVHIRPNTSHQVVHIGECFEPSHFGIVNRITKNRRRFQQFTLCVKIVTGSCHDSFILGHDSGATLFNIQSRCAGVNRRGL